MEEFSADQIAALSEFVSSERFSNGQSNRELHIKDISPHQGKLPAGVIWPTRTETTQTAIAVFIFTLIMALFFWALDSGLLWLTRRLVG